MSSASHAKFPLWKSSLRHQLATASASSWGCSCCSSGVDQSRAGRHVISLTRWDMQLSVARREEVMLGVKLFNQSWM